MKTIKWVMTSLVCIQTSLLFVTPHSPAYAADIVRQPSVKAGSTADDFWTRDHLFGDMGGLRTQLHDMGIDFQIGYVSESVTNWTGGKDQYVVNAGQATFGTTFDLQRLLGDPNAIFQITLTSRSGSSLGNAADLGTLMGVNELHGRGNIVRLTQFYYDQTFANGTWDWKIGRLTIGEDFAAFSCDFINLTFCGNPSGNMRGNYIYNWPVSQWGTRIKTLIPDFGYAQVGIYDVNKAYLNTAPQYALAPSFPNGSTGVMIGAELGWTPTFGQLPGLYKFGFLYDTSAADDVFYNSQNLPLSLYGGTPRQDHGRYVSYINFKQQLTTDPTGTDPKHGVSAFLNATFTDLKTSNINFQIAGGFIYHGLFEARPNDDIGFGIGTTHVNPAVATGQSLANLGYTQSGELTLETFYGLQATGWLNIKGSLQYIHNPGGYGNYGHYNDAWISGLRATIVF